MSSRNLTLLILALSLQALSGCNPTDDKAGEVALAKPAQAPADRPAHAVEIEVVKRQSISISRTLTGTLEAPRTVHVHGEQTGRIVELPFFEGDKVKQGTVIARLDDAVLRAQLAKAVATRKQAEIDMKRLQKLASSNLSSEDLLAKAGTALELAVAEESLQRTLLERTVIRAPFAAVISERLMEPGDIVALNEHLLTLFDPDYMTAAVQVPEQLHSRVAIGDSVEVRIDSLGDRSFVARILRIHPEGRPADSPGHDRNSARPGAEKRAARPVVPRHPDNRGNSAAPDIAQFPAVRRPWQFCLPSR